jgi:serine/threonine protein kinase
MRGGDGLEDLLAEIQVPERLGPFRILRELGRGGMGVVYEALQEDPRRRVAVKVLPAATGHVTIERFRREAQALAALQHPGIVAVHTAGVEGSLLYYAMELVEGQDLDACIEEALREGLLPDPEQPPAPRSRHLARRGRDYLEEMVGYVAQAARAIHHAHQAGIIHRDLKPGNILVRPTGQVVVLDFGLAHLESEMSLTHTGELFGTPAYMSPEQVHDLAAVDHRTDVYSLGVTLYELLTGQAPFAEQSVLETLTRIEQGQRPALRSHNPLIAPDLARIVDRAMEPDPDLRYQTALELADDLERFLSGLPVLARPLSPLRRLGRWARRNRLAASSGATALLLALLVPIVLGVLRWRDRVALLEAGHEARSSWIRCASGEGMHDIHSADPTEDPCFLEAEQRFTEALVRYGGDRDAATALFSLHLEAARRAERQGLPERTVDRYYERARSLAQGSAETLVGSGARTGRVTVTGLAGRPGRLWRPGTEAARELGGDAGLLELRSGLWVLEVGEVRLPFVVPRWGQTEVRAPPAWPGELPAELVVVTGGPALLGATPAEQRDHPEALPRRRVELPAFALGRRPVTRGEYHTYLCARGDGPPEAPLDPGAPVQGVTLEQARAYATWQAGRLGRPLRLPTADELEKAGRNVQGWRYPWGMAWDPTAADVSLFGVEGLATAPPELTAPDGLLCGAAAGEPPAQHLLFLRRAVPPDGPLARQASFRLALDLPRP